MEISKILMATIVAATLISQTHSASLQKRVTDVIPQKTSNAIQRMKNLNQFITSSSYVQEPPFTNFPPQINAQSCTSKQLLKDNLTIAYEKVSIFIRPLYMALSYEKTQGPLHSPLAQVLSEIHTNVNASSVMLSSKMVKNGFNAPTASTGNSTAQMNQTIRVYLQALANNNLLTGPVTNDMVTIYRNYVVLYSLSDVIKEVAVCVFYL